MNPETRLTNKIMKALKKRGGFWVKIHGSAFQASGIPDILGCYKGLFVALEVKIPEKSEDVSLRQRLMMKRIRAAGGIPIVVTSAQAALEVVDAIDRQRESKDG